MIGVVTEDQLLPFLLQQIRHIQVYCVLGEGVHMQLYLEFFNNKKQSTVKRTHAVTCI
jgi:hypothetical protein